MKISFKAVAASLAAMLLLAAPASAGIVIDVDPLTPGAQDTIVFDPGTQTVSVSVLFDNSVGTLLTDFYNGVGVDIAWDADPTVSVTALTDIVAGTLADSGTGVPASSNKGNWDVAFGAAAFFAFSNSGHELGNLGLANPDPGIYEGNIGGGGYYDASAGSWTNEADFTGSTAGSPGDVLELFTAEFEVTGVGGDSVTFVPFGIFEFSGGLNNVPNGDSLISGAITDPEETYSQTYVGGGASFTAVPEPSSFALLTLVGFGATRFRKRRS
ncbi:MAG: PEP-CTERM sorting domain-containing protein [Aureliella sp.]